MAPVIAIAKPRCIASLSRENAMSLRILSERAIAAADELDANPIAALTVESTSTSGGQQVAPASGASR